MGAILSRHSVVVNKRLFPWAYFRTAVNVVAWLDIKEANLAGYKEIALLSIISLLKGRYNCKIVVTGAAIGIRCFTSFCGEEL